MNPMIHEEIADWAASKGVGICVSSLNALSAVGEVREFLRSRRTLTGIFSQEPVVDKQEWLRFYNSPKTLERRFFEVIFEDQTGESAATMDALRNPVGADDQAKLAAFGLIVGCFANLYDLNWDGGN
jgi:hypothetical protein